MAPFHRIIVARTQFLVMYINFRKIFFLLFVGTIILFGYTYITQKTHFNQKTISSPKDNNEAKFSLLSASKVKPSIESKTKLKNDVVHINMQPNNTIFNKDNEANEKNASKSNTLKSVNPRDFNLETSFNDNSYQLSFFHAYQKGQYTEALEYGENLLKIPDNYSKNWWYGNLLHTTHIILGKIYLLKGNIKMAEKHLLESVTPKYVLKTEDKLFSPQLSSFGPDTSLAYDLYLKSRYDTVIEYFEKTKIFWQSGIEDGTIDRAILNIQKKKNGDSDNYADDEENFPFEKQTVVN